MTDMTPQTRELNGEEKTRWLTILFIGFALLCFATSTFLNIGGNTVLSEQVSPLGDIVGPITTNTSNQSYLVNVSGHIDRDNSWKFVSVEVLDHKKDYLFAFGDELWRESGYDGSHWSEFKTSFEHNFTLQKPGTYYLKIEGETGTATSHEIKVRVTSMKASSLAHFVLAVLFGAVGVFLGWTYYENYIDG